MGCNARDGRASQPSVRRYRDGELGADVNFISEIVGLRGERPEMKGADPRSGMEPLVWG